MSGPALLILLEGAPGDALAEGLRIGVGLAAAGLPLAIWSEQPLEALEGEAEAWLEALMEEGVSLQAGDPALLEQGVRASGAIVRIAPPRPGRPELLLIDEPWLAERAPAELLEALREAGQVIRLPDTQRQK